MHPLRLLCWICYLGGGVLVFGSYLGFVPIGLAWVGWGVSMVGWLLFRFTPRKTVIEKPPPLIGKEPPK